MREEDKVLLFCEVMGQDTSPYVVKYVEELRSSEVFLRLCDNVAKARTINSYKAQRLIDEFELIDFSSVTTLQKFYQLDAKIHYLLSNSEATDYINPFFYSEESDQITTVGQISIDFDCKRFSLDDMILDERYTARYKVECIKECYIDWRKEVKEKVISPLQSLIIERDAIAPKPKMFDMEFLLYAFATLGANLVLLFAPLVPSHFILSLYAGNVRWWFSALFSLIVVALFLLDIYFILAINLRLGRTRIYRKALRALRCPDRIMRNIDLKCEELYAYILHGIDEKRLLKKNLKTFAFNEEYLAAIAYLLKAVESGEFSKESKTEPHLFSKIVFLIFTLFIVLLFALYFLMKGGII